MHHSTLWVSIPRRRSLSSTWQTLLVNRSPDEWRTSSRHSFNGPSSIFLSGGLKPCFRGFSSGSAALPDFFQSLFSSSRRGDFSLPPCIRRRDGVLCDSSSTSVSRNGNLASRLCSIVIRSTFGIVPDSMNVSMSTFASLTASSAVCCREKISSNFRLAVPVASRSPGTSALTTSVDRKFLIW